jgi:hypothetical protein
VSGSDGTQPAVYQLDHPATWAIKITVVDVVVVVIAILVVIALSGKAPYGAVSSSSSSVPSIRGLEETHGADDNEIGAE